jgi:DNA mismatch repair protein MutS
MKKEVQEPSAKPPTPMMKQFLELKTQYSDCILLFRAGDFYETFYDDAKVASKVLGITLTKRGDTPMAGVPFHSINPYIKKLVQNNYKVAMCEQLEDPKQAKGLVKRGVTRVITPGTILEDEYLASHENNFIMCIYQENPKQQNYGIALVDITTGEFICSELSNLEDLKTTLRKYSPQEVILNEKAFVKGLKEFITNANMYHNFLSDIRFNETYANQILKKQFQKDAQELNISHYPQATISSGALLFYIYKLQKLELTHINTITYSTLASHMIIDATSLRNLEITESIFTKDTSKTLYGALNNTKTASGARLLKKQITEPLINKQKIEERFDAIEEINECIIERNEIRELLDDFYDIERITARIASGIVSPKDLYALKLSLEKLPQIKDHLELFTTPLIKKIKELDILPSVSELLENSISPNAPAHTRDIGYIKKDFNEDLKDLFNIAFNSKEFLSELEEQERLRTGISTLKINFNRVFGYYIDVPKAQISKVPEDYEVRQTLANNQRYTKPELKEKEDQILGAEEKIKVLELELFNSIIKELQKSILGFQTISRYIGELDVLLSHSLNSQLYNYTRPTFSKSKTDIVEGRNPLIERFVTNFIANDTYFDSNETFKLVTGPNAAGKSTYLRQNALLSIMAQMGSFIPATSADMKIYDRIFTRIGAHDELSEGQSTFMVEMSETANILHHATENSLVLLDEIGRGTSTYDGLSLAWAISEELNEIGSDTIFATHYHQLNKLSDFYETIQNYNVLVREENDEVEFIRKIVKGGTDKSYGVYVAKLCGVPKKVLDRAVQIQQDIESKEEIKMVGKIESKKLNGKKKETGQNNALDKFM